MTNRVPAGESQNNEATPELSPSAAFIKHTMEQLGMELDFAFDGANKILQGLLPMEFTYGEPQVKGNGRFTISMHLDRSENDDGIFDCLLQIYGGFPPNPALYELPIIICDTSGQPLFSGKLDKRGQLKMPFMPTIPRGTKLTVNLVSSAK